MNIRRNHDFHDGGLLGELELPLRSGVICRINEPGRYAALVNQRFPFVLNRIDWSKIPGYLLLPAAPKTNDEMRNPDRYFERRATEFHAFINDAAAKHGIGMETPVLFMGDGNSFVLRMAFAALVEYSTRLFSYPQHAYVIPMNGEWCLNYTFEDDLFFGFALKPFPNLPTRQP